MKNSELSINGQISPLQIINDFKSIYNDAGSVKDTLIMIFSGFFASQENEQLDRLVRESIAFDFNRTIELVTRIENFQDNNYSELSNLNHVSELHKQLERKDRTIEQLELAIIDKKEIINLLEKEYNKHVCFDLNKKTA